MQASECLQNNEEQRALQNTPIKMPPGENLTLRNEWSRLSRDSKAFAARAAIIASIGGLLFGYDIGVVEGALPELAVEMNLSLGQQDMVVAVMMMGAVAGSLIAGYLTDRLGRWLTIVLTDLTFIVGGGVLFAAQSSGSVLVGRFIVGMAVSVSAVADVSYLAEVAPQAFRGGMVSMNELAISIGMLASFVAGHVLREVHGGWRFMFGVSALLAALQLGLMLVCMPRSPRWLMTQKRCAEARDVLLKIRNSQDDVDAEMCQIELSDRGAKGSLRELVTEWRLPLLVTTTLAVFQQLTGQSNILSFTAAISRASGFRTTTPAVVFGAIKVLVTSITIACVDKVGRRPFLLWGAAGCTTSLWVLSIGFVTGKPGVSFLACCALIASYSLSFGPVTWLITAEMFPAGVRGKALGIGQIGSFTGNLVASGFFLRLLDAAGGFTTFFLFGSIVFISTVLIYTVVPETKGKEPEYIASEIPLFGRYLSFTELADDGDAFHEPPGTPEVKHPSGTENWL